MITNPTEMTLEYPVTHDGVIHRSLMFSRITGKQLLSLRDSTEGTEFRLFAMVCNVPVEVIEKLDADDFLTMAERAVNFMPRKFREQMEAGGGESGAVGSLFDSLPQQVQPTPDPLEPASTGPSAPTGDSGTSSPRR